MSGECMVFGLKKRKPNSSELALLTDYAYLLEAIGETEAGLGLPESLLPADRFTLQSIIARASIYKGLAGALKKDDLRKLYGGLYLFFPDEVFASIRAARAIAERVDDERLLTKQEVAEIELSLSVLTGALAQLKNADQTMRAHAASLVD